MSREVQMTPEAVKRREAAADLRARKERGETIKRGRRSKADIEAARRAAEAAEASVVEAPEAAANVEEIEVEVEPTAPKAAPSYAVRPIATDTPSSRPTIPSGLRPKSANEPENVVVPPPAAPTPKLSARATIRRLRGLIALGYAASEIAKEVGISTDQTWHLLLTAPDKLRPTTIDSVAATYKKLAQRPPLSPEGTPQFSSQQANRDLGRTLGWATFFMDFDEKSSQGLLPVGAVASAPAERGPAPVDADTLATSEATTAAAVSSANAATERLKGQLREVENARKADKTAADEKIAGLEAQLDEAAREISRLKSVEVDQNRTIAQQGVDLSSLRLDREDAFEAANTEIEKLRREVHLLRLTGTDVTVTLGAAEVPGVLVDFDIEANTVSLAIRDASGKPAQTFDLDTWQLAKEPEALAISPAHLSLVSA